MAILLLAILMAGAVSAADTVSEISSPDADDDTLEIEENEIYTTGEPGNFTELQEKIDTSSDSIDITKNYRFDNEENLKEGIFVDKNDFTINGNNYIIDANNQSRIFKIDGNNVTISNLVLINGNSDFGGAIFGSGKITLNNVTFISNNATKAAGAIAYKGELLVIDNCRFVDNYAEKGASIYFIGNSEVNMYNSSITSKVQNNFAQIMGDSSRIIMDNVTFLNIFASYAPALHLTTSNATIRNSKFINLTAIKTAGAIGIKEGGDVSIENCEFINTTSSKNAGAIYADIAGAAGSDGNLTIISSLFKNVSSGYGGALIQLGGKLFINNSDFVNNKARLNGGSVYISFVSAKINNCTFDSNRVEIIEGYPTYGGALYSDYGELLVTKSRFINNTAFLGNAIYAIDTAYNITNSTFVNNANAVYTDFDRESYLDVNNVYNNDTVSLNNTFYTTIVCSEGINITLINNTFNVAHLPVRYDSRDWVWVSEVKNQGNIQSCWTFGMTGAIESALLKSCGIKIDLSQNNMRNLMLKYSNYGHKLITEAGMCSLSVSYLVSWLGTFSQDYDSYDEFGKISPLISSGEDIHIQDVMFVSNFAEDNGSYIKSAIFKYGSVDASFYGQATIDDVNPYYDPNNSAQYVDKFYDAIHEISIIGWDDNYPATNFLITPPGNGAWIVKNSYGKDWGKDGIVYVSYYDKTLSVSTNIDEYATAIIIENDVHYNKNYQHDIVWSGDFISGENISYANLFYAVDDDLIAGVGTYFERENINYTIEIYVNNELRLTQKGVSPYFGFHTVKLDKYIPVKQGDVFYAQITSDSVPVGNISDVRTHFAHGMSFVNREGNWSDLYDEGKFAVLKIYTVSDDVKIIDNQNMSVVYGNDSYFSVRVVTADGHAIGAGEKVIFTINGKTTEAITDDDGIAKLKITQSPKTYIITTTVNGKSYNNTITVSKAPDKVVLKANKVTVKKTAKKFALKATLKINGKAVKGKKITFKFKGKTYTAKTNKKGVAKVTIKKDVIKKLKKGKKYTVKISYLKNTIKTTVKVK